MTQSGQAERRKFGQLDGWLISPSSDRIKRLVVLLHGWGADAGDLAGLAEPLSGHLPDTLFFAADAPDICAANPFGRQWFDINDRITGPDYARPYILEMLAELASNCQLPAAAIGLAGFSQGGMMSLATACRLPSPCAAAVCFSGALLNPDQLPKAAGDSPPILLIHGTEDQIVPPAALAAADARLTEQGWQTQSEMRPGLGHGIDEYSIAEAGRFLARHLG